MKLSFKNVYAESPFDARFYDPFNRPTITHLMAGMPVISSVGSVLAYEF